MLPTLSVVKRLGQLRVAIATDKVVAVFAPEGMIAGGVNGLLLARRCKAISMPISGTERFPS